MDWRTYGTIVALGGVALLAACSPATANRNLPAGTDRVVEISMEGMRFVPDRIEARTGETIAFVVTNPTNEAHELFIGTRAEQDAHAAMHAAMTAGRQADVRHGGYGIFLDPHGTGIVSYHFADATEEVLLGCHLPGHWEAGMHAEVSVTE